MIPCGRGRGNFKKLPRNLGEARRHQETTPLFFNQKERPSKALSCVKINFCL